MLLSWNRATTLLLLAAVAAAGHCWAAEPANDERLPNQQSNRGVLIVTEGKPEVYVDMPKHYDVGSPSISPDGKWIAFDANTIGRHVVRESWLVGVDGKGLRKLCDGAAPRWFPDGKRLLVTRDSDGHSNIRTTSDIFEIQLPGGKERKLCAGRFGDWSPDGKQLVFARQGDATYNGGTHWDSRLFIAKADGSEAQELANGDWPSWSPDGKMIAFCRHEGTAPPTILVIDLATKQRKRLGAGFYRPQWAADSKSLVAKGLMLTEDGGGVLAMPTRFWLAKDRLDFFFLDRDNPWSPCLSRDGRTVVAITDSAGHKTGDE